MQDKPKKPTLLQALMPVLSLMILLTVNVLVFGDSALDGSNQIVLVMATAIAIALAMRLGYSWQDIQQGMVGSLVTAIPSLLILLLVGALAGSWLLSGIIPAMIYYGLQILSPTFFLVGACIVCIVVSTATGSSWTTVATIGIALMGIGKTLGLSPAMIAGAILSGAYFGDKLSPLSDTTNLAAAVSGTDLFTHIRYMTFTTVPSISIAMVLFLLLGFWGDSSAQAENTRNALAAIQTSFNINIMLFLVPAVVVLLIVKKKPALPSLFVGIVLGAVFALLFQPDLVKAVSGSDGAVWRQYYIGLMKSLYGEISIATGNATVDELLKSSGMAGMLGTVWLIIVAMIFGGVMEMCGALHRIIEAVSHLVKSTGSLVAATVATCGVFNVTASDQYLAIVVPGRMYTNLFRKHNLAPENLSRSLEDSGTVTSVLVPWNTCGAYHANVLGVATLAYLPFCFFNLISPFMSIAFAYMNIKIRRLDTNNAH